MPAPSLPAEIRYDRFLVGGSPAGALVRLLRPGLLDTLVVFALPGGQRVERRCRIEWDRAGGSEAERWERVRYEAPREGIAVEHTNPAPGACVPSYADVLVVERLSRARAAECELDVLEEDDGELARTRYVRHVVDVAAPRGLTADSRVDVHSGAKLLSRHWCASDTLVASDWMGAFSFRVASLEVALTGVPDDVAYLVRETLSTF